MIKLTQEQAKKIDNILTIYQASTREGALKILKLRVILKQVSKDEADILIKLFNK